MIARTIALLFAAVALAGCCAFGNGCHAPLSGTPVAWDGLGPTPTEDAVEPKPKRPVRLKTEVVVGPLKDTSAQAGPKSQPQDRWAQEQAADQDADARLTKQLMICHNC
jgi:hypothetical protein